MTRRRRGAIALLAAALSALMLLAALAPAAETEPRQRQAANPQSEEKADKQQQRKPKHKKKKKKTVAEKHGLAVEARAFTVVDARTGAVLLSEHQHERLPIASTTKLMTAYVAMKDMPLDKVVTAQPYDPEYGESLMGLHEGEKVTVRDLLYGLILLSGNDAAHTLAVAGGGTQARFVRQMNRYAAALGLSDTHYANPVGLDQRGNYSSAADLATLTRHLMQIPAFRKISDSRYAYLPSVNPPRRIKSINELLFDAPWVTGVKTGHTFGALYVLVGSGKREGVELISDVIGSPSDEGRFEGNLELLEYGFDQYSQETPISAGHDFANVPIKYSGGELPLRAARSLKLGVRRGQQLEVKVDAPAEVEGPIRRGARLGLATAYLDGMQAGRVPLMAGRAIPEASTLDKAREFVDNHLVPIAVAAFVILVVGVALTVWLYRRRRRRKMATG